MFFFQAEDGIRDLVRSRGLGDVYKRQGQIRNFFESGGSILACGTCLKIRQTEALAICPISTLHDLNTLIRDSDKILSF